MPSARKTAVDHIDARMAGKRACVADRAALIRSFTLDYNGLGEAMANPDRALLVELLNRLGSTDDAIVLAAARELHQKAAESGLSWDELLQPDQSDDVDESHESAEAAAPAPGSDETARLIDRLLRKGVSDTLREDLTEM